MSLDRDLQAMQDVRDLLARAKKAQKKLRTMSQGEIDRIVHAMVQAGSRESEYLARLAVEDSGFGIYESKIQKNKFATDITWDFIKDLKTVGIIHKDEEKGIYEVAEPAGVVGAMIPITNPTSTALYKCIAALKARCAIVVSPHPRGIRCIGESCRIVYEAATRAGAPDGCIGCLTELTMEAANYLMSKCDIVLATGGMALVKAAYSSGRPALGVGPGNPPAYIHPSADVPFAVRAIVKSQTFDNATICSSEQSVVCDAGLKEQVVAEFERNGAYIANDEEIARLERILIDPQAKRQNPDIVGQYPRVVAEMAGFSVPYDTTVILCDQTGKGVGFDHPLSIEKLCPILALYAERDWEAAADRCRRLLEFGGDGHTMAIHAQDEQIIWEFGMKLPASRVIINGPTSQGSIGFSTNLVPSMTLGCGTYGHNITTDNISPLNLIMVKRIAFTEDGFVDGTGGKQIDTSQGVGYREHSRRGTWEGDDRPHRYGPSHTPFQETAPLSPREIEDIIARSLGKNG